MNPNFESIKEDLANGEKFIPLNKATESFYLGENGIIQSLLADKELEKEFKSLLKAEGLSAKRVAKRDGYRVSILVEKSSTKRTGYSLILETGNNGNFEEVKRLAKKIDPTKKGLQLCHDGWIVELNKHNSDIVEKLVETNDTYSVPFANYVFKGICSDNGGSFPRTNLKAIEAMIRVIDRDNSTQVWQHDKNRVKKMASYIKDPNNHFWARLEKPDKNLIEDLIDNSRINADDSDLVSLSSKVCKFLFEYINENNKKVDYRDAYFISDRFVRRALPFYCDTYNIDVKNFKLSCSFFNDCKYEELFDVLEKLQAKANSGVGKKDYLNKHRIDHILWFCYRNGSKVEEKKRQASTNK